MKSEEWRSVPSLPDVEVSDVGHVRHKATKKPIASRMFDGRRRVWISSKVGNTSRNLKSLVYEAFHGPQPVTIHIEPKDGNEDNVRLSNLRAVRRRIKQRERSIKVQLGGTATFDEIAKETWSQVHEKWGKR